MGAGASASDVQKQVGEASPEAVQACISGMDAESRAKLNAALGVSSTAPAAALGAGPIDTSSLKYRAKSDDMLLPQPENPKFKVGLLSIYVDAVEMGGSDKLTNGHRFDSIPICNGMINSGMSCQVVFYEHENHDEFFKVISQFDGLICRVNPGQIKAAGGSQDKFDKALMEVTAKIPVWPTPDVMAKMGAKDALCNIREMDFGLPDTLGYYSPDDIDAGFRKTIAFQPRVVKQNRGSAGEGIWIIKLKSGNYCEKYLDRTAEDDEMLILKEANDNHEEEHTVKEFVEWCVNGNGGAAGEWKSKGSGKYFEGGVAAGGQMVDQRFLPRIDEGESRFMMIGTELNRVEHYLYIGGVGGETKTTIYGADAPQYQATRAKLEEDIEPMMKAMGLGMDSLPLLWAADFIPVDGHKTELVIGEFNCSCLGLAGYLNARGKDLAGLSKEDVAMGQAMADLIGQKALQALETRKS